MKLGVLSGPQNCSYDELRRLWRLADDSGFYSVHIWDHFFASPSTDGSGACFEGVTALTALALETKNVRVGSLVFCMGFRHPAVLAKAAVTIDHISNGRLELGLGAGWYQMEYTAFGIPFTPTKYRLDILDEGVQVIRSMLHEEKTNFSGQQFDIQDAYCRPRPVQRSPRIWIGGGGERRTLRIAAKYADGWNAAYVSPSVYKHKRDVLDEWCAKEGRDPDDNMRSVNLHFLMGIDDESANRKRQEAIDRGQIDGALTGKPADVLEQIERYADAGAQEVNIALRGAPFDWEAIQAFVEEVLPNFS